MTIVFLSYSHADADVLRRIASDLKEAGHTVWVDSESSKAGDPLVLTIQSGLEQAEAMLVLWSQAAAESGWVSQEWQAAVVKLSDQPEFRVIVAKLDSTEPPLLLKNLITVDLGRDYREGLSQVIWALAPTISKVPVGAPLVWYFDDDDDRLAAFERRHAGAFEVRLFSQPAQLLMGIKESQGRRPDVTG